MIISPITAIKVSLELEPLHLQIQGDIRDIIHSSCKDLGLLASCTRTKLKGPTGSYWKILSRSACRCYKPKIRFIKAPVIIPAREHMINGPALKTIIALYADGVNIEQVLGAEIYVGKGETKTIVCSDTCNSILGRNNSHSILHERASKSRQLQVNNSDLHK